MGDATKRIISGILVGVLVSALVAGLAWRGILSDWEASTYDWRLSTVAHLDPQDSKILMMYVDQASLDMMEKSDLGWPWPRALYADVLQFCKTGGARAVIFDIIYSEDSIFGVADDDAFANGLAETGNGFLSVFLSQKIETPLNEVAPLLEKSAISITDTQSPEPVYPGFLALPISPLMQAARGFGNVQLAPDPDGIYRRMPLLFNYNGTIIPSLYMAVFHAENPGDVVSLMPGRMQVKDLDVPLDAQGNMILKYYGGVDTFPTVGLAQVVMAARAMKDGETPSVDPSIVKDKIVIIGVSAPGLYDLRPQPLASRYPGAEIHATAFQNILTNDHIRLVPMAMGLAGMLVLAMLLGMILRLDLPQWASIVMGSVGLLVAAGIPTIAIRFGWWAPMVAPVLAVVATFAATIVVNYLSEGRKKRAIRDTFQKYLAPTVVKELLKHTDAVTFGGAEQDVTVYFSDIAGFTDMAENMTADALVAALNDYLTRCSQIIMDAHGTIDKYIGDAVMAFWGAPLAMPDHAEAACVTAVKVQKMLAAWNAEREKLNLPPMPTRIGIHSGKAVVGNMGSVQRMNYTAMGDTVNLASRLEGINKFFGTQTIASSAAVATVKEKVLCRHLAAVRVKGRHGVIEIYELRGEMSDVTEQDHHLVQEFEKGLAAYRDGRLDEAQSVFEVLARDYNDVPSKRYVQWIKAAARAPMGSDWDGVVTFDSK